MGRLAGARVLVGARFFCLGARAFCFVWAAGRVCLCETQLKKMASSQSAQQHTHPGVCGNVWILLGDGLVDIYVHHMDFWTLMGLPGHHPSQRIPGPSQPRACLALSGPANGHFQQAEKKKKPPVLVPGAYGGQAV